MKRLLLHLLPIIGIAASQAQETLTLKGAVSLALENNFDIRIASNDLKIDELNISLGNAGMLPSITAAVINNNTVQYATLQQASGAIIDIEGARNFNISYGIGLEWTLFDGFKMFSKHKQLKESRKLGETELRIQVLSKVSEVYSNYFEIFSLQKQLQSLDSIIAVSEFRLETAQNRFSIGKASKLEVLNAEVDFNADKSTLVQLREQLNVSKIRLNQLMAREPSTPFAVEDTIIIDDSLNLSEIQNLAARQNPELQSRYIAKRIQELELKQIKADRYPTFSINTGYDLVRSQSPFGFITESEGRNFTYGFTARLNIFDGFNQNRNEKVAALQLENTQIAIEQQTQDIEARIAAMYQTYLSNVSLTEIELKNERIAKENLEITLDKFKIGTISAIEFRTAQVNYANAVIRLTNAQFLAKQSEIALKELAGNLDF